MKTLQNNFTTTEQSKRLLELGVPAWTADCYNTTKHIGKIPDGATYKDVWRMSIWRDENGNHIEMYPCWSVGRLIEIMNICSIHNIVSIYRTDRDVTQTDIILETIINRINGNSIDFSKLEE